MADFNWEKDKLTPEKLNEMVLGAMGESKVLGGKELVEKLKAEAAKRQGTEVTTA